MMKYKIHNKKKLTFISTGNLYENTGSIWKRIKTSSTFFL